MNASKWWCLSMPCYQRKNSVKSACQKDFFWELGDGQSNIALFDNDKAGKIVFIESVGEGNV